MRPSSAVAFDLRVAEGCIAAESRGRKDWLAFVGVGLLSESAALRAIEFAALDEPAGLALDATPSSSDDCVSVPTRALPTAPGLYELRHFRGPGWTGGLASTSGVVVVATSAPVVDGGWTWIELCPAVNLTGLGVGFVSAPAEGAATSVVLALSSSRELWGLDLPRSLITMAERQLQAAVPPSYAATIVVSAAWNAAAAAAEVSTGVAAADPHAAARAPVISVPAEVPADCTIEARSDSSAASVVVTGSSVSAAVAARTSSDMKHRLSLLFTQLTTGHGRPEACRHPLCASNPSNARLSATAAATRALHLLSSGASDDDLLCRAASES